MTTASGASAEGHAALGQAGYAVRLTSHEIRPTRGLFDLDLGAVWRYRELLLNLIVRDLKVRYRQAALGAAWAVIQPVFAVAIFTVVFGHFAQDARRTECRTRCSRSPPTLPWTYFAEAVRRSGIGPRHRRRAGAQGLLPAPRHPARRGDRAARRFRHRVRGPAGLMLRSTAWRRPGICCCSRHSSRSRGCAGAGGGAVARADQRALPGRQAHAAVPASRSGCTRRRSSTRSASCPRRWRWLYSLNPMVGVIEGFRWALFGKGEPDITRPWHRRRRSSLLLVGGLVFFKHMERAFADLI